MAGQLLLLNASCMQSGAIRACLSIGRRHDRRPRGPALSRAARPSERQGRRAAALSPNGRPRPHCRARRARHAARRDGDPCRCIPPARRATGRAADRLGSIRQARSHPLQRQLSQRRRARRAHLRIHRLRGAERAGLGPARLCHRQCRPARYLVLARPRQLSLAAGGRGLLRRHRMGRDAALEQRQGRAVRRLLPDLVAVARGRTEAAASGGHQSLGGLERHLSRGGAPRRYSRDLVLALSADALGPFDDGGRGAVAGKRGAPVPRRILGKQGGGAGGDRGAGLRGGELERPGPAHARHAGRLQAHLFRAKMAGSARAQEVGVLL